MPDTHEDISNVRVIDQPVTISHVVPTSTLLRALTVTTVFAIVMYCLWTLSGLLVQLLVAGLVTIATDQVVHSLQHRGLSRGLAIFVVFLGLVATLILFAVAFIPPLVEQVHALIRTAPGAFQDLKGNSTFQDVDKQFHFVSKATGEAEKLVRTLPKQIGSFAGALVAQVFSVITFLFLVLFLLTGGRRVVEGTARIVPQLTSGKWWTIVTRAYRLIGAYMISTIVIAIIAGFAMLVTLLAVGVPYAVPLSLWMLLLDIVPLIGATIGAIPAVIVAFAAGGVIKGIIVLAFVVIYQQVENVALQPKLQGKAVSLAPVTIFVSVLAGSQLLGIVGALIAVPIASVMAIIYQQYVEARGTSTLTLPQLHHTQPGKDIGKDTD